MSGNSSLHGKGCACTSSHNTLCSLFFALLLISLAYAPGMQGANVTIVNTTRWNGTQAGYVNMTPQAGNITSVTHSAAKQLTDRWALFTGNVSGTLSLSSNATASVYTWTWSPVDSGGTLCLTTNTSYDFTSISGALGTDVDTAWVFDSDASDNGNRTFNGTSCSVNLSQSNATATNRAKTGPSTPDDAFYTCPIKSPSGTSVASGEKAKMAFCAPIIAATGKNYLNESADYEIIIPTPYAVGTSGNEVYYFFVNLG